MDLLGLIRKRRSARNFEDRPIPDDLLDILLEAAVSAPSGGNIQPLSVIAVRKPEARQELSRMVGGQPWVKNAPLSLIFCIDFFRVKKWASIFGVEFRGPEALCHFLIAYADIMCAAQTVVMLAESRGLGSVYIGTIMDSYTEARAYFNMPEYVLPAMVLTIGYPKSVPRNVPKLEKRSMIHMDRYRVPGDEEIRNSFENKYGSTKDHFENYLERAYVEVLEADKQARESWVEDVREQMRRLEIKNNAEFLFKLRYPSDTIVGMNQKVFASLAEAGFEFK